MQTDEQTYLSIKVVLATYQHTKQTIFIIQTTIYIIHPTKMETKIIAKVKNKTHRTNSLLNPLKQEIITRRRA